MLDKQKFFADFEGLVKQLDKREITREQLVIIKDKLIREKELISIINELRGKRNWLSQEGPKNAEKVRNIKERIALSEKELNELEIELSNLTSQIPNLPAPDAPTNEEGNKLIDSTEYQHNIQHNLTHE